MLRVSCKKLGLTVMVMLAACTIAAPAGCDPAANNPLNDPLTPGGSIMDLLNKLEGARPADVPHDCRLVYSFNLIGKPADQAYDGNCGNGHRIFVNRDANNAQILVRDLDDGWHVENCNATDGNQAELHTDGLGIYDVYVRILGPEGAHLHICADPALEDPFIDDCSLGTIDLTRGQGRPRFTVHPDEIFDAELEDILWNVDTNSGFRIAQFRVYECTPQ
jgi:hypothetical protein